MSILVQKSKLMRCRVAIAVVSQGGDPSFQVWPKAFAMGKFSEPVRRSCDEQKISSQEGHD
jgi:hypothetical protein